MLCQIMNISYLLSQRSLFHLLITLDIKDSKFQIIMIILLKKLINF